MEPSRLTQLPADLTSELALRLPWRDIYTLYVHQPDYRRYDDPNHPLWRALFRRDLSTYPLPDVATQAANTQISTPVIPTYRDQFFWGHQRVEQMHGDTLNRLAGWGYDVALLQQLSPARVMELTDYEYNGLIYTIASRGYLDLLIAVLKMRPLDSNRYMLVLSAVMGGHLPVVKYLFETYGSLSMEELHQLAQDTTARGQWNIMEYLIGVVDAFYPGSNFDYCRLLHRALMEESLELVQQLMARCPTPAVKTPEWFGSVQHMIHSLEIFMYLAASHPQSAIRPKELLRVAIEECNLDFMEYAYQLGAELSERNYVDAMDCTDPGLHQWMLDHGRQSEFQIAMYDPRFNLQLIDLYLDALTTPIDGDYLVGRAAVRAGRLPLVKLLVEHPLVSLTPKQILDILNDSVRTDIIEYLFNRLSSGDQIQALSKMGDDLFERYLKEYRYSAKEYTLLLSKEIQRSKGDLTYRSYTLLRNIPAELRSEVAQLLTEKRPYKNESHNEQLRAAVEILTEP